MKIERVKNEPVFDPIKVNLTFESIEELEALWAYLNVPTATVIESNRHWPDVVKCIGSKLDFNVAYKLFCVIDDILRNAGYAYETNSSD